MKTNTVNNIRSGKWSVETYGQESVAVKSDQPDFDGLNRSVLIINHFDAEQRKMNESNAELIVQAVNACKEINPDNPLNVAKLLPKMLEVLENARVTLKYSKTINLPHAGAREIFNSQYDSIIELLSELQK